MYEVRFNYLICSSIFFNFLFLKDARDLGISIELLPLTCPDEEFNVSQFYAVCPFFKHEYYVLFTILSHNMLDMFSPCLVNLVPLRI